MNGNQFAIASSWNPRPDSPARLGQRMLQNLDALSAISPYFRNWQFVDLMRDPMEMTEENAHEYLIPLETMRDRMTEMVELGVRKDEFRQPEPNGGYGITASNYVSDDPGRRVTLASHGGGIQDPRAGQRYAGLDTAYDTTPDPVIVSYPVWKSALNSIISAWEGDTALAYSDELRKHWNQPRSHPLDLAWMTYLSPQLARKVTPPGDVLVERMDDGGLLLIAAEETFDAANAKHMAAARSILASLADLNAEMEAEYNRLWPTRRT